MASAIGGQCTALNLSDETPCQELATSFNGLFCVLHSKQCQGLYRGYKNRNADLDKLSVFPPQYLADSNTPLPNQLYGDVDTEELCHEIHEYLFRKFQLLERVIGARKAHHIHFFSMNCDYGHAKFLDQLQTERAVVNRQLERIERRHAEILYEKRKWFKWVRQCQDDEEAQRDKEQKKVKQEAALFRRHWKEVQQRRDDLKAKEKKKMQDALLEKLYKQRLAELEEEDYDYSVWDPIENMLENQRGKYVDLIKHFLWMVDSEDSGPRDVVGAANLALNVERKAEINKEVVGIGNHESLTSSVAKVSIYENLEPASETHAEIVKKSNMPSTSKKSKSSSKKKIRPSDQQLPTNSLDHTSSDIQTKCPANEKESLAISESSRSSKGKKKSAGQPLHPDFDKNLIETREEIHDRLKNGTDYNFDEVVGVKLGGTIQNPVIATKTITYPDNEIKCLLDEVSEIKHLLFCRLLLGHAILLPAALRADSVEAFLNDPEVIGVALRDICLKMARPGLQEIRDACADLFRNDDEDVNKKNFQEEIAEVEDDAEEPAFDMRILKPEKAKGALPDKWISKREKARNKLPDILGREDLLGGGEDGTTVDFGEIKDDGTFHKKMIRVKICGRSIWNYPSNRAMTRSGWLHFSIVAKDSNLHDAIALCRHWDEFFDLNILATWHYFPSANWVSWVGNQARQQMLQLGFIIYFEIDEPDACELTRHHQTARGGPYKRTYSMFEVRNFICAHIKRDDPVSRRLIQYLHMQMHQLLMLVRDAETGQILVKPPEEERWLTREKSGFGRAAKGEWKVLKEVGPKFFEEMDTHRKWHFGFKEYYDIILWDLSAGQAYAGLYNRIQETLFKAYRFCHGADLYNPGAHILKTLTKDKETARVRDLRPGDDISTSIYAEIHHERTSFFYGKIPLHNSAEVRKVPEPSAISKSLFYTEADALEDEVLFPEEHSSVGKQILGIQRLKRWEEEDLFVRRFIEGCWSDSEKDTSNDEWYDEDEEEDEEEEEDEDTDEEDQEDRVNVGDNTTNDRKTIAKAINAPNGLPAPSPNHSAGLPDSFSQLIQHFEKREEKSPDMEDEYMAYFDKEKAKIFKEVWHKADLEPHGQPRYIEMKEMVRKSRKFNQRDFKNPAWKLTCQLLLWLDAYRNDTRDLYKAVGKLFPFFCPEFLDSEDGKTFKNSLLFKQEERAKKIPVVRSSTSNARRPKSFWNDWDKIKKSMKDYDDFDAISTPYDVAIRPIIARLYKAGVVRNRADPTFCGQALAAIDPKSNTWDLFFDWRHTTEMSIPPPKMRDPYSVPLFLTTARAFTAKCPNARFAILRLWSAPHFYPLSIGYDNRDATSFQDLTGRMFVWMFVPKDMPFSEWSMHHASRLRIEPFEKKFGDLVVVKRNAFLVMGKDEEELQKFAIATTYAIQRRPWRWEVDLWKSFVNVDLAFLETLQEEWLE